jgi:hypothetical protein
MRKHVTARAETGAVLFQEPILAFLTVYTFATSLVYRAKLTR